MDELDYSNNKLVIVIGVLSWLIIVVANVYVIVELGLGCFVELNIFTLTTNSFSNYKRG